MVSKKVLIVGFSIRSGVGAARLLHKLGGHIAIWDSKNKKDLKKSFDKIKKIPFDFYSESQGDKNSDVLKNIETIILSPGVPQTIPLLKLAKKRNIPIVSEVELAYFYNPFNWIAITGTDGKTTTTTLVAKIFKEAGYKIAVGGNIGKSISAELLRRKKPDYIIVELSSFQLETVRLLRPKISAILNITPDHLNRYKNFDEYKMTKSKIYQNQNKSEYLIVNRMDKNIQDMLKRNKPKARVIGFKRKGKLRAGAYIENGVIYFQKRTKKIKVIGIDKLKLQGEHNKENILAAVSVALLAGIPLQSIKKTLLRFEGLEHRTEFVGKYKGVQFINDSKATTLHSVEMALLSRSNPVILLMGGRAKDNSFQALNAIVKKKVRLLITFGEAANLIYKQLDVKNKKQASSLKEAIKLAFDLSQKGDDVLLSPGCASFDEFENYEKRGAFFKKQVKRLGLKTK